MDEKIKALLVGVNLNDDPDFENALKELESLAEACDMEVVGVETQNVSQINTGVYVGTGKVDEIKAVAHMLNADVVIFDNTLSPMQLRNLKDIIERPILDRTNLILQIFSSRAQTREAKIQVETARLQYELPRLTGMGEVLSRQGGTSGGMSNRGAGETKLELDKRKIRHRISELKKELKVVEKNRETQRKRRLIQGIPQVALVGYTNAGKSTLMNALLDKYEQKDEKKVLAEDMLFATLDTNVRLIQVKGHTPFLLSDTVGFLEHLPKPLLAAFDATLKEAQKADLLLHIIDISDPQFAIKREVTIQTLQRIGCAQLPCMEVYNKVDLCSDLQEEKRNDALYISAHSEEGMRQLLTALDAWQWEDSVALSWRFAYDQQRELSSLYTYADIETRTEKENGIYLQGKLPSKRRSQFRGYECEEI